MTPPAAGTFFRRAGKSLAVRVRYLSRITADVCTNFCRHRDNQV